jgi:hypothetical protein
MPIIQGVAVLALAWFTYKLFQDFGWEVLHLIGADRKLKVRIHFQPGFYARTFQGLGADVIMSGLSECTPNTRFSSAW